MQRGAHDADDARDVAGDGGRAGGGARAGGAGGGRARGGGGGLAPDGGAWPRSPQSAAPQTTRAEAGGWVQSHGVVLTASLRTSSYQAASIVERTVFRDSTYHVVGPRDSTGRPAYEFDSTL